MFCRGPTRYRYSQSIAAIPSDARLVAVFALVLTRLYLAEPEPQDECMGHHAVAQCLVLSDYGI
jgi:hypothetical protein